jgi:hypothetical protein
MCLKLTGSDGKLVGVVCGMRRTKAKPCEFCGVPSTKQCDFSVSDGKTCDAYMCDRCSVSVGENLDHCAGHARVGKRYRVVRGSHEGHLMLMLAWRQVPKWPGARRMAWKYAAQCSCLKAGDLDDFHLALLDITTEVAA